MKRKKRKTLADKLAEAQARLLEERPTVGVRLIKKVELNGRMKLR